ncbi:hypothetical protein [Gemmobacter sp.]|uniref:hypothetical protein n=1 Tax=Gemmobacter sp. TaxID=1898957 RepID=UPI002AFEDA44|nr:hypothetical protein [Gemmobacter sp.]
MLTYPDGWDAAIARYEARRAPLDMADGEGLPPLDVALEPLLAQRIAAPAPLPPRPTMFARKRHALAEELQGLPDVALLHGLLVASLRKRSWPDHAPALFRRLWAEQGAALTGCLSTRWLISAAITFADHGASESERRLGQSLKVLFSLLKLTEFERLYSGQEPGTPFRLGNRIKTPLPMEIEPFSLRDGGLDINLLAPLVVEARAEPVLGPLAMTLLDRLNADPGTVFRRLGLMRDKLLARKAAQ